MQARNTKKTPCACSQTAFREKEIKGITLETTIVNGNNRRKNLLVNTVNSQLLYEKTLRMLANFFEKTKGKENTEIRFFY